MSAAHYGAEGQDLGACHAGGCQADAVILIGGGAYRRVCEWHAAGLLNTNARRRLGLADPVRNERGHRIQ